MGRPSFLLSSMIDEKLTADMQAWLAKDKHDRESLEAGATMVLKLTRNRAMYNTIITRPERFEDKIRYELNKFLPMRLDKMTMQAVKELDRELVPEVAVAIEQEPQVVEGEQANDENEQATALGQRPDHNELPEAVRNIWDDNRKRWLNIKKLYNTLLTIEQPCDRYEYLKQLKELWYDYKSALEQYDNYVAPIEGEGEGDTDDTQPSAADMAKAISSARSYITKNVGKLAELRKASIASDDAIDEREKYDALRIKVQERVTLLADNGAPMGDDLKALLNEAGISI